MSNCTICGQDEQTHATLLHPFSPLKVTTCEFCGKDIVKDVTDLFYNDDTKFHSECRYEMNRLERKQFKKENKELLSKIKNRT